MTGKKIERRTANTLDEVRLDVTARGFWAVGQIAFFDIESFHSNSTRCANQSPQLCYALNKNEKRRKYKKRVMNMERGCFTPLVLSANSGMGREWKTFYSTLAEMIATKRKQEYCIIMSWLRRKTSFLLMRSILLCIHDIPGKSLNQEEMNVGNDIEMSGLLPTVQEQ